MPLKVHGRGVRLFSVRHDEQSHAGPRDRIMYTVWLLCDPRRAASVWGEGEGGRGREREGERRGILLQ